MPDVQEISVYGPTRASICLQSVNYVNVVVADKQDNLQYLAPEVAQIHCSKGIGIWQWASNDAGEEPDVVMASCGDRATLEPLAATALSHCFSPGTRFQHS